MCRRSYLRALTSNRDDSDILSIEDDIGLSGGRASLRLFPMFLFSARSCWSSSEGLRLAPQTAFISLKMEPFDLIMVRLSCARVDRRCHSKQNRRLSINIHHHTLTKSQDRQNQSPEGAVQFQLFDIGRNCGSLD